MMNRILLAFRAFFRILFDGQITTPVSDLLDGQGDTPAATRPATSPKPKVAAPPSRSEALTLLAALQREARFIDFIKEPLDQFNDAQIGAVARDVHRDCGTVLERVFAFEPVLADDERATVEVPTGFDASCYQLTGNVAGDPPFQGQLVHHGWKATKCDIATWSGSSNAVRVIAPAEVELK
jgi:hypothetical protein